MATVDVMIPAYNAAGTVRETLESVQAQTFTDWRLVIVNDGSTDATGDILAEMAAKDPRIEVYTHANKGIVDSLNVGLSLCTADIIARLDADDLCYPHRLQFQLDYLKHNPDVIGVGAGVLTSMTGTSPLEVSPLSGRRMTPTRGSCPRGSPILSIRSSPCGVRRWKR